MFKDQNFEHESCTPTHSPWDDPQRMVENVEHICGYETVHLKYSYKPPMFASSEPGKIRLLLENPEFNRNDAGKKYTKKHNALGTLAFRFDSVFSHLSMLNGAFPNLPYGLKPNGRKICAAPRQEDHVRVRMWNISRDNYYRRSKQQC